MNESGVAQREREREEKRVLKRQDIQQRKGWSSEEINDIKKNN